MTFHIAAAYGVAVIASLLVVWMGIKNRQSEWRRVRSNTILDVLLAWAAAKAELRRAAPEPSMTSQLSALNAALNVNAGVSPVPTPAQLESTVPIQMMADAISTSGGYSRRPQS
jgi:hypothetical protein